MLALIDVLCLHSKQKVSRCWSQIVKLVLQTSHIYTFGHFGSEMVLRTSHTWSLSLAVLRLLTNLAGQNHDQDKGQEIGHWSLDQLYLVR